jgi:hypothetical protein
MIEVTILVNIFCHLSGLANFMSEITSQTDMLFFMPGA